MEGTTLLVHVAGGVALLLWGVRMVRTGVSRAFGATLRHGVARCAGDRLKAFLAGLGVTAVLQSSTATALIVASFAGRGLIPVVPSLAVMLGADVGTSLVVQVLSLQVDWVAPLLVACGVATFLTSTGGRPRHVARVLIGFGLILLSLRLIVGASEPLRHSESLIALFEALAGAPLLALVVGGGVTWLAHSSVAVVLLVMSLAANGVLPLPVALALVLGANLGGALIPLGATAGAGNAGRRAPVGNAAMRLAGIALALPLLPYFPAWLALLEAAPGRQVVNFHTAFNLALALLMLPLVGLIGRLVLRFLPEEKRTDDPAVPRYLDADALDAPVEALACAARETLRMGDLVEQMLRETIDAFRSDDERLVRRIEGADNHVDKLHEAIKLYLISLSRTELDESESARSVEILTFTTNLEHIGDIIDKNLMELAQKKIRNRLQFSPEGWREIEAFHARVMQNLKLAFNVFMTRDPGLARQLLAEKAAIRTAEMEAAERHLTRLRAGTPASVETSSLHMDILRDLKRVNSHLTSVVYPILETRGELAPSRLLETPPVETALRHDG
jgi:phosphate:Na+ symporter